MSDASAANISPCGTYRYTLHRRIPSVLRWVKPCLFVMLNPSTADATKDDPTIRRCIGFAKREGCTGITVVNLFALRATHPVELDKHVDPFGPDNAKHLSEQISAHFQIGIIVAAWGASPMTLGWEPIDVLKMALRNAGALCLGMTKDGHPRHPLYVKGDHPLVPWTLNPSAARKLHG
jgi:hypothetical protein